ncbi:tetratricopeptide repeat protein [Acidobacterium sp. S8]|uniref:tetratricopeptide repeat protein n=1 Tax=Acidobacterium sp. S8 TaxID=1641854 RepID=UPI00131D2B58|nr:tetratricopeptide repeat protein [Acidobacterium sp. S8]
MRIFSVLLSLVLLAIPQFGIGQQSQNTTLESLLAEAQKAQAGSDYAAAANEYKQAVKIRPDIPELWANLGLMEHETGDYPEAIRSFQQARKLKPTLYVPNLFLGIDLVHTKKSSEAIPYLLTAEKMNESDLQPHLTLGRAYFSLQEYTLAAQEFSRAAQLDPKQGTAWFSLGLAHLDQVESDARKMSAQGQNSPYTRALYAESLVSQSRYNEAAGVFKNVFAAGSHPPCVHSQLGFAYLRQQNVSGALAEFAADSQAEPGCALAVLGEARSHVDAGEDSEALMLLTQLWTRDAGFIRANASPLVDGLSSERSAAFAQFVAQQYNDGGLSADLYGALTAILKGAAQAANHESISSQKGSASAAAQFASGQYRGCADSTEHSLTTKNQSDLRLLAACSYFTGDYEQASRAGAALNSTEGLYWSVKANERLAFQALNQYEQLEPNSARTHLLLGDIYVQRERYDDALGEYQKALDLSPDNAAALEGLTSAYLRNGNTVKAVETAQLALAQTPNDPEINLLMGEALVARHEFAQAEPFLTKGLQAKPQMLSHVHALLGRVYAETGRTQEAIRELKLGVSSDEDGSVYYQLSRLYRETGDNAEATAAIEKMKALQQKRRENAVIAFHDAHPSTLDDTP